jgi:hypothetical protein
MTISNTPGAIKKFDSFVETIVSANEKVESGTVIIDEIVFEPENLNTFLNGHPLTKEIQRDYLLTTENKEQVKGLLVAVLSDWIDFLFIPTPIPFVIYADHDEYTTFYTNTKSNLNSIVDRLLEKGFKQIINWQRQF